MKNLLIPVLLVLFSACSMKPDLKELQSLAATETYPEDDFLKKQQIKRAMVIVAHDDDDCAMSGTIASLHKSGWKVKQITFQVHGSSRKDIQHPAALIYSEQEELFTHKSYRSLTDKEKAPYLPISMEEMENQFPKAEIKTALIEKIKDFDPVIIFSLDDEKGGYGHPEHVFISKLVREIFDERSTSVQRIYQSVFTDHMETEIVDKRLGAKLKTWGFPNASEEANKLYKIDGMPEPNVQINIEGFAEQKMEYLTAYNEDVKKNLRKFLPHFEDFSAEEYFSLFDREFFRILK